jgi:hypothetical protein
MRYFVDTEFYEHDFGVMLISIGVVSEDGNEFYAESSLFHPDMGSDWLREHVVPQLTGPRMFPAEIANRLRDFVKVGPTWRDTEFWAYYGAYDWYNLCKLFGGMLNLPPKWPWLFHELRTFLDESCMENYTQPDDASHHALNDARWNRKAFMEATV